MFLENNETEEYYKIVKNGYKTKPVDIYTEKHHIIPRSLGGHDRKNNLVYLSAKDHFRCHQLLIKMTEGTNLSKMWNALWRMMNKQSKNQKRDYDFTSEDYETARIRHAEIQRLLMSGENNPFFGHSHSNSTKKKMSERKKGKTYEEIFGKEKASEMKQRRSSERSGKLRGPQTKIICPHCKKIGGKGIMKRWHGDRCKLNSEYVGTE